MLCACWDRLLFQVVSVYLPCPMYLAQQNPAAYPVRPNGRLEEEVLASNLLYRETQRQEASAAPQPPGSGWYVLVSPGGVPVGHPDLPGGAAGEEKLLSCQLTDC